LEQRVAYGSPADAKTLGEWLFAQHLAFAELAREHGVAQMGGNLFANGPVYEGRFFHRNLNCRLLTIYN
jgi:hypothetical protein